MGLLRVVIKTPLLVAILLVAASVPVVARVLTFGRTGPSLRLGSRCCRWWCRASLWVIGVEVARSGSAPANGAFLVAANHLSYLDIWLLGSLYPTAFIAKEEIASWPVMGFVARAAGTLFVDRENARSLVRVAAEMREHLARGISMTLFPEGWASRGETVEPFMPSLLQAPAALGVPCVAASISYETPGTAEPPSTTICWWGRTRFPGHFARVLSLPRIVAHVRLSPEPVVSDDRKRLARTLHDQVLAAFRPVRQQAAEEPGESASAAG